MSYHHCLGTLGSSFNPFAALQQATTAAQQAADIAKRTSDAATQVQNIFAPPAPAPALESPRLKAPISASRLSQFRPALVSRLAPLTPSVPANTRSLSQQAVDLPKDDDKEEKSNTTLYVALGLAAVAALFLLKKG